MSGNGYKNTIALCSFPKRSLDSDQLELNTRQTANQYLKPLSLETEEMFASFIEFRQKQPLLSVGDRSTLAIARTQFLLCASIVLP